MLLMNRESLLSAESMGFLLNDSDTKQKLNVEGMRLERIHEAVMEDMVHTSARLKG